MKRLFYNEWKRCIGRVEYQVISIVVFLLCISAFIVDAVYYYGAQLTRVRSAADMAILQSVNSSFLLFVLIFTIPLFAGFIYSDVLLRDTRSRILPFVITRISFWKVVVIQQLTIFSVVFCVYFTSILFNQLLTIIAFPIVGVDNNFNLPAYDIGVQNYNPLFAFDAIRIQSPYVYNILHAAFISLFASLLAVLSYSILFVVRKYKFTLMLGVLLMFMTLDTILTMFSYGQYSLYTILQPGAIYPEIMIVVWAIVLKIIILVCNVIGLKKEKIL